VLSFSFNFPFESNNLQEGFSFCQKSVGFPARLDKSMLTALSLGQDLVHTAEEHRSVQKSPCTQRDVKHLLPMITIFVLIKTFASKRFASTFGFTDFKFKADVFQLCESVWTKLAAEL
jgi:hypothetical protein